jgi:hypothetical protein
MHLAEAMNRIAALVLSAVALGSAGPLGCSTKTSTTHVWQANVQAPRVAENVIVFAGRMTEATRRTVEDSFVRELSERGTRATPSYRLFPQLPQRDIAHEEVHRLGFDAAIVATLREIRERNSYVPGHYHGGFWGSYYGPGWGPGWGMGTWSPGYVVTDELVNLETTYWDLRADPGELLWATNTETRNPRSTTDFVESYTDTILPNLEKLGVIRKKK